MCSGIERLTLTSLQKHKPPFILRTGLKNVLDQDKRESAPLPAASDEEVLSRAEMPAAHLMLNTAVFYL